MVKVVQVIKKLNNTELGKGGTHDTYVLIPQNLDISDLFPIVNEQISFINKENGKIVNLRHTSGREKRIVGLGPYYNVNCNLKCNIVIFNATFFWYCILPVIYILKRKRVVSYETTLYFVAEHYNYL